MGAEGIGYGPLGADAGAGEDLVGDAGAGDGRVRVHRSDEDLELRHGGGRLRLGATDQREGAGALAVQAHVLGVRLRQRDLVAVLQEHAHRRRVLVHVARREALPW